MNYIKELYDEEISKEIISVYYGALNLWCFTDGAIDPLCIVKKYIDKYKEK